MKIKVFRYHVLRNSIKMIFIVSFKDSAVLKQILKGQCPVTKPKCSALKLIYIFVMYGDDNCNCVHCLVRVWGGVENLRPGKFETIS